MDLLGAPMEGCVYLRVSFLCLLLRAVLCYCVRFYTSGGSGFLGFLSVVRIFTECFFFFVRKVVFDLQCVNMCR